MTTKQHPSLEGLPDSLKSLTAFNKIENKFRRVMYSDHKHRKVGAFMKCKRCKDKLEEKKRLLKEYGFRDYHQYLMYRKVMQVMYNELKNHEKETA